MEIARAPGRHWVQEFDRPAAVNQKQIEKGFLIGCQARVETVGNRGLGSVCYICDS